MMARSGLEPKGPTPKAHWQARCGDNPEHLGCTAGATKNGDFGARSFASAASNESLDVKANKRVGVMEVQRDPAVAGRVL